MARKRKSNKYISWRNQVYYRDMYTCKACSRTNVYLNCHHIKPWSHFRKLRYQVSNGVTLCGSCHQQFHETYGNPTDERVFYYFLLKVPKTLKEPTGKYGPRK